MIVGEVLGFTIKPVPQGVKFDVVGTVAAKGSPTVSIYKMLTWDELVGLKQQVDAAIAAEERRRRHRR